MELNDSEASKKGYYLSTLQWAKDRMSDLFEEYEGENGVGTQPEIVGSETFPQGEEALIFNNLQFTICEERQCY